MNRKLMIIAKALLMVGLLFPIPIGYGLYYLVYSPLCSIVNSITEVPISETEWQCVKFICDWITGPLGTMPLYGFEHGYWWPILAIFGTGLMFAAIVSYIAKPDPKYLEDGNRINPAKILLTLILWGVILTIISLVVIYAGVGLIGFSMAFIVKPMFAETVVSIIILASLIGLGFYGIFRYKKDSNAKLQPKQDGSSIELTDKDIKRERWMRENNISENQLEELRITRQQRKLSKSRKRNIK